MRLTDIMKAKGVTSQELADATGLNKRTIDEYRNQRKGREPSLSAGLKIADYLGIDPHILLEEEKEMKIYTADRETGNFIEEVKSVGEGKALIAKYEDSDKEEGTFVEDFYDVVDQDHCSLIR